MQDKPVAKIKILEAITEAWNRAAIDYAVAHGLEGYPQIIGRDLDVIVDRRHIDRALKIALEFLQAAGFVMVVPPSPFPVTQLFAFHNETSLEIDLIPILFWGPVLLISRPSPSLRIGPFKIDPWASFAKRVLMYILSGQVPKEPWITAAEELVAQEHCPYFFGSALTQVLLSVLKAHDQKNLEEMFPQLRRQAILRSVLLHPLQCVQLAVRWASKEILPYLMKRVPIVAIVGPDGVGKTTVLDHVRTKIPSVFLSTAVRHLRPDVLPRLEAPDGEPEPTSGSGKLIRHSLRSVHVLRLLYYWMDFTIGHFLKDRYDSSTLHPVLYDGWALDMVVKPLPYGLRSTKGTRLFSRLVPKPDLVILLYDEPDRIHARNPELAREEIERQLKEWLSLAEEGKVDYLIKVDAPPEQVADWIINLIVEMFLKNGGGVE